MYLGIDPGLANCGWALLRREGSKWLYVDSGVWQTKRDMPYPDRVRYLADHFQAKCAEATRVWYELPNGFRSAYVSQVAWSGVATIITIAHAVGQVLRPVSVSDVKMWAGHYRASKEQVEQQVRREVEGVPQNLKDHQTDALAVVMAAHNKRRKGQK